MNEITFLRFECEEFGHITTVKYGVPEDASVSLDHCAVCGSTDVRQVESESIRADIIQSDTSVLSVEEVDY